MSDNEIRKALEQKIKFSKEFDESEEAIIKVNILEASFDYINRLEAENERLKNSIKKADNYFVKGEMGKGLAVIINLVKDLEK